MQTTEIDKIIDGLMNAICVCNEIDRTDNDPDKSYPFAVGYSRVSMQTAVQSLRQLKQND